ncbi:porin family protein [Chitinophaga sp. Hz27]|uniref:porin family protein n=1 Tax=Chitinophaga sp. Hz27 TaxID=3347169 RepID=UPI0035E31F48
MKRVALAIAIICCSYYAQAQFRIGVKAGIGGAYQSKITVHSQEVTESKTDNYLQGHKVAYYAGVSADWQLSKHFSFQPSLLYSSKGGNAGVKWSGRLSNVVFQLDTKGNDRLNYLELPVNLLYKQKLGAGKAFIGAGLYEAMFLNGHIEGAFMSRDQEPHAIPITATDPVTGPFFTNPKVDAKKWDTGANFTAGYEFPFGLQLALNYSLGLTESGYGKNRVYTLAVSYYLHK